jgi:hypothetical protein
MKLIVETDAVIFQRGTGEHVHGPREVSFVLKGFPRSPPSRSLTLPARSKQVELFRAAAPVASRRDVLGEEYLDRAI